MSHRKSNHDVWEYYYADEVDFSQGDDWYIWSWEYTENIADLEGEWRIELYWDGNFVEEIYFDFEQEFPGPASIDRHLKPGGGASGSNIKY